MLEDKMSWKNKLPICWGLVAKDLSIVLSNTFIHEIIISRKNKVNFISTDCTI